MPEAQERETSKQIRKNHPFIFFSEAAYEEDEISEYGMIENVGILKGTATTRDTEKVYGRERWATIFEIETPPIQTGKAPPIPGDPIERLVMFATLPNGDTYGSYRRIVRENGMRLALFDQWHKTDGSENKNKVIERAGKIKGSPLTVDEEDIFYIKFEFK